MEWYLKVLKQYADFKGRARRQEFWMFLLFHMIILFVLGLFGGIITTLLDSPIGVFPMVMYSLAMIVPSLAVVVRRLHDQNKSGWMYFIAFIPFIGGIWLLVLLCTEGTRGDNMYGPDPKERRF